MNIDYWEFYNTGINLDMPDKEIFNKIFCVTKNYPLDITQDMINTIKNSVHDFSEFSIRPKDDDQWIIYFKNKDVFQINSREVGLQIVEKYNERFKEMKEIASECQKNIDMRIFWDFASHNKLLETVLEKIKIGEPVIGACDACLRYFPNHERKTYDKLLTKFVDEQVNAK